MDSGNGNQHLTICATDVSTDLGLVTVKQSGSTGAIAESSVGHRSRLFFFMQDTYYHPLQTWLLVLCPSTRLQIGPYCS
jgi:hypothetical protein